METEITQPKEFSPGIYYISIKLTDAELRQSFENEFYFELPEFTSWLFRSAEDNSPYMTLRPKNESHFIYPFLGLVHKGRWEFILQSNGVEESRNPIACSEVIEALEKSIKSRLSDMNQ